MLNKYLLALIFVLAGTSESWGDLLFGNTITGTNPNTSNPYTIGQSVPSGVSASGIGRGIGINGTNTNDRYNATGWDETVLEANTYFTFSITPDTGLQINFVDFQVTLQRSNNSISNFSFRSSLDSYTTNIGVLNYPGTGTAATTQTVSLSSSSFQGIQSNTEFRLFSWGAASALNTLSVNDFAFNGSITAVPEPTSIAFLLFTGCRYFIAECRRGSRQRSWKI
ncbi:MAG TPA: hypothetical protein VM260_19905 [Pirellula sp.]|nr:hypothetical protein [Pirellula sp.]